MRPLDRTLQAYAYLSAAVAVAPGFLHLQLPVQVLLPLAALLGLAADRRGRELLKPLPATLLAVALFLVYLVQLDRDTLVTSVVNLLALLLALRLVTEKTPRHLLQIFVLALFVLAASSLLTLSLAYAVFLVLLVGLVTVGLVLLSCASGGDPTWSRAELRRVQRWALLLPVGSLLLMLVFFAILPRTQYPLWNFLNPTSKPQTGFAEQVRPGTIAALAADPSVAFRAELPQSAGSELYWRGIVLNRLTGSTWSRDPAIPADLPLAEKGAPLEQTIYLEPRQDRFLPALDVPRTVSGLRQSRDADFVFRSAAPLSRRSRLTAVSQPGAGLRLAAVRDERFYLQVPPDIAPRLRELAGRLAAGAADRQQIVDRLAADFRARGLEYASTGLPPTAVPVETFLFETHRGYCEYFATSYALLLRLAGVPARLVGGYLGGEYNQVGGYYLVTEEMAHVWVEALSDERRWVRIDPSRFASNAGEAQAARRAGQRSWVTQLGDGLGHLWNRTVINYDLQRQIGLLREARSSLRGLRGMTLPWQRWLAIGLLVLAGGLLLAWRVRRQPGARTRDLGERFRRLAGRYGPAPAPPPGSGLFELARRLGHPLAEEFAGRYAALLYRDRPPDAAQARQLRRLLRRLTAELASQRNSSR